MDKAMTDRIDEILSELEKAYTYYHKSHDASAGTAKLEAKQAILSEIAKAKAYARLDEINSLPTNVADLRIYLPGRRMILEEILADTESNKEGVGNE